MIVATLATRPRTRGRPLLVAAALLAAAPLAAAPLGAQSPAVSAPTPPAAPVAAQSSADAPLPTITLFGELRTRSEWDHAAAVPSDAYTLLRSRLGARVDVARGARIVMQLQDSRVLGANAAASAANAFDLHQGYLELSTPWRGLDVALRAGRQEIALGNERLVGSVGWSNTGRTFDAARVMLAPRAEGERAAPWSATLFAATVEERGRRFGVVPAGAEEARAPDHAVVGLFAERRWAGAVLQGTLLHDAGARYRTFRDAERTTLDARVRVPSVLGVAVELEGAVQGGSQRVVPPAAAGDAAHRQDVAAWLLGARVGTPATAGRRASLTLGVDVLSGDTNPGDDRYGAFNTLFATNHPFYGRLDVIGEPAATTRDRGLVDALATGALALSPAVMLKGELHRLSLATGGVRALGWEADAMLPVRLGDATALELGYAVFRAGPGAETIGLAADGSTRQWAYLQLRAGF